MKKVWLALMLLVALPVFADDFLPVEEAFQVDVQRVGSELLMDFDITDGYYLYRDRYKANVKEGAMLSDALFSDNVELKYDPNFDEDMAVFHHTMQVRHQVLNEAGMVQVVYQGCAEAGLCYAPQKKLFDMNGVEVLVDSAPTSLSQDLDSTDLIDFDDSSVVDQQLNELTVISAILFAIVGGLILNLMPCVFPVLSLKAMQLAQSGQDHSHARLHGLAYTVGVVGSFIAVAGVLLLLRNFGEWVGWGFQLQSPYFVAGLILLFFVMSLTMYGYIEFGQGMMGIGQELTQKSGMTGSFFTGVLATVVATPCTAPFMGSAIGFALLQPAYVSLLIFAAMGFGLALPILLFSFIPALVKWMPKPGAWMTTFRQLMAFPLFATVLWLVGVLVEIQGTPALMKVGLGLILLAIAMWPALSSRTAKTRTFKFAKGGVRYALLVAAIVVVLDQRQEESLWQPYTSELVSESLAQGKGVFVDVTAAWCITCKANERIALSGDGFEELVRRNDIVLVRADWTQPSPEVDALISDFNRQGVPLYAYYPAGSLVPEILPQLLTSNLIKEKFEQGT
jgi:thiol:disulfide interchange protein